MDEAGAIVGRTAELASALDCVRRAAAGDPRVLLVTGPAGIGKTRLVQELCARITAQTGHVEVRIGESAPLAGASLPFGPFVAALDDYAESLLEQDAGMGAGAGADMGARRHILFVQMLGLLGKLAAQAPFVMVLEDLHWADQSSRELLSFLAVRLRDQAVALIGTLRADELDAGTGCWLAELERRPRVTALRLGPLPDAEIAEVVADLLPAAAGAERLSAVIAAAEGNPLYARELARSGPDRPPASIAAAVLARVATLSGTARALVDQVCVADGSLRHDLLAATTQLTERQLLDAIREAVGAGLLACTSDGYAFGHTLIRQVVHGHLLPGERQRLHRELAAALARVPDTDPGLLAQHWHLAGCPELAAPAALLAARQALSARAYPEATRSFELAIQLARWLPEPAAPLLETAAQAASWAKAPGLAVAWATAALASPAMAAPADQARLLERLGHYQWEMGDPRAAVAATEQAAALAEAEPPSALQARVFASLATRQLFLGDYDKAGPLAERAVASACQTGATAEHARGLTALGIIMANRGDITTGLRSLGTAAALARQAGSITEIAHAASNHMYLLCTLGRFAEALDVAREGRQDALALGAPPSQLAIFGNNTAAILVATGRWQEAERLLAELLAEAPANMERYLRLLQLELAVGRGDDDQAGELAAILTQPPDDPRLTGAVRACLAEHALYGGDLAAAATAVTAGLAAVTGADLADEEIRLLAAGAWLAAELAQLPPRARPRELGAGWDTLAATLATLAARAEAIADQHGASGPDLVAFGALVAAEDARRRGRDDRGTWRAVADAWRTAGQPYREAYARLREAGAAVSAGRREQAARALAACEGIGAELPSQPLLRLAAALTARARLRAQAAAVPRQRGPATAATATAQFDLTERETQVLMLLTTGSSNREIARSLFISDRTVAVHVSRILAKLGVPNRAAAAAVGTRLDFGGDTDG